MQEHDVEDIRDAFLIGSEVLYVVTEVRERASVEVVLVTLVEHATAFIQQP
ncbi:hypothetical protein [Haloactinopolyspora alba]|uniref:hypothetical protein n=1 Tax=Haloactinopolyspora alba TaxID=648780 RepID=UPI0013EB8A40|nr:hypothetical protein [Haloactinopolyspora alba]